MRPNNFEQAVFDRWGRACVVCGRKPEEWLNTDDGNRVQDTLSFHHVNGDDTDDHVDNVIPLCQSCHVHIHRVDEPPYRKWHRQLPLEHRHAWNADYHEYYEGPQLTRAEAERRFGDDKGTPESVKYLKDERDNFDPVELDTNEANDNVDNAVADGSDEPGRQHDNDEGNDEDGTDADDSGGDADT